MYNVFGIFTLWRRRSRFSFACSTQTDFVMKSLGHNYDRTIGLRQELVQRTKSSARERDYDKEIQRTSYKNRTKLVQVSIQLF